MAIDWERLDSGRRLFFNLVIMIALILSWFCHNLLDTRIELAKLIAVRVVSKYVTDYSDCLLEFLFYAQQID